MTKSNSKQSQALTDRQLKAIPHLVASTTLEEGRTRAKISKETLFRWLKDPVFKAELVRQRDLVVSESLEVLKQGLTRATEVLVTLLDEKIGHSLKRLVANDVIGHVLKVKEIQELERRISALEEEVERRRDNG